ncbi:hypothetical protein E3V97_23190 [Pedobacter alluvionis]|uniref:Uncharacterized protein n=1 Tax=Pedobacter alluvionis TaxID=475253 RepID=A0ABY2HIR9_9SPHI|nr:hypothetical protein E3V97_23190 [Pedobacter alluvionis]
MVAWHSVSVWLSFSKGKPLYQRHQ